MDYVNHWNQLFSIYKQCSRIGILKRNGNVRWYWIGLSLYVFISLAIFFLTYDYIYNLMVTIVAEFAVAFVVGYALSWKNGQSVRDCSSLSIMERELYSSYRMFKLDFISSATLSTLDINDLLAWNEARFKKIEISSVFYNPIFILFLSGIMSLVASMELVKSNSGYVLSIIVLSMAGIVPLLLLLQDYLYSERKRYFNVCKFLKWIELDKKTVERNAERNSGPRLTIRDGSKIRPFSRRKKPCGYCLR